MVLEGSNSNILEAGESMEMKVIDDVSSESVDEMAQRLSEKYNMSQALQRCTHFLLEF